MGRRGSAGSENRRRDPHDLRVAEVVKQDIHVDERGEITFRTKLELSFKYEHEH
jgi:flavin-binding protein dodecin